MNPPAPVISTLSADENAGDFDTLISTPQSADLPPSRMNSKADPPSATAPETLAEFFPAFSVSFENGFAG